MRSGIPAFTKIVQKMTVPRTKANAIMALNTRETLRTVHGSILRTTRRTRCTAMLLLSMA